MSEEIRANVTPKWKNIDQCLSGCPGIAGHQVKMTEDTRAEGRDGPEVDDVYSGN